MPPAHPTIDNACFCNHAKLIPFKTGTTGVCDGACPNPADLSAIQKWFTDFCAGNQAATTTGPGGTTQTSGSKSGSSDDGGGGTWYALA